MRSLLHTRDERTYSTVVRKLLVQPTFGRKIGEWVEKAYLTVRHWGNTVVMLLPARTDTKWFHDYIYGKAEIRFVRGRLKFGKSKNSAPFPSMIVIFRGNTCAPLLTPEQMAVLGRMEDSHDAGRSE